MIRNWSITFVLVILGFTPCIFVGCADEDEDDSIDSSQVVSLELDENLLTILEKTVLQVDFTFSSDGVFDDGENVVLAVKLPDGILYVEGSAELDTIFGDDGIGAQVSFCSTGETFLVFDMDNFDLNDLENPEGNADGRLTLTVQGLAPIPISAIEARADDNATFRCEQLFVPDQQVAIGVL